MRACVVSASLNSAAAGFRAFLCGALWWILTMSESWELDLPFLAFVVIPLHLSLSCIFLYHLSLSYSYVAQWSS
jgi:hypothetical protein